MVEKKLYKNWLDFRFKDLCRIRGCLMIRLIGVPGFSPLFCKELIQAVVYTREACSGGLLIL